MNLFVLDKKTALFFTCETSLFTRFWLVSLLSKINIYWHLMYRLVLFLGFPCIFCRWNRKKVLNVIYRINKPYSKFVVCINKNITLHYIIVTLFASSINVQQSKSNRNLFVYTSGKWQFFKIAYHHATLLYTWPTKKNVPIN